MKTVDVSVEELPKELWRIARACNVTTFGEKDADGLINETVKMDAHLNNGGHFIFGKDGLPLITLLSWGDKGYKTYVLDEQPARRNQDASDLPLYEEIFDLAHLKKVKDDETCKVIRAIDFLLIAPLLENIFNNQENEQLVRELRGRILRAKFNAVTIWREGRPRKEAADHPDIVDGMDKYGSIG